MARPITLFTGQWADLPFEEVARLAGEWGYDGLEIACWGDHFDPWAAVEDDGYVQGRRDILAKHGLEVYAISNHLTGQAVCDDPIDERHHAILPARVWGDGEPEGVRQRAAEAMKTTARAAAELGVDTVVGFTGSKIWKTVAPVARGYNGALAAQRHRRFIKSHTPLDELPFDAQVSYVCVGRDPRDVGISWGRTLTCERFSGHGMPPASQPWTKPPASSPRQKLLSATDSDTGCWTPRR